MDLFYFGIYDAIRETMIVTFLPSSNGFGHLNRCILLASFFKDKGWKCNIWCLQEVFDKMVKTMPEINNIQKIDCLNLSMPTIKDFINRTNIAKSFILEASEKLSKNDLIISDNHIESLLISKKVILSANFFWHQNFTSNNIKENYSNYCVNILKKFKPYIISSEIFQDRVLMPNFKNIMIGLIVGKNSLIFKNEMKIKKDSILVSAGLTNNSINEATSIIEKLVDNKIYLQRRVFIEPRLMNNRKWPKEIEAANYTGEMYKSLIYAFIRPGLGTLVNCLSNNVCPICFSEDRNPEMKNNKNVIKTKKIGLLNEEFDIRLIESKRMEKNINRILLNIQKLNFNGTNQFYDSVLKIIN